MENLRCGECLEGERRNMISSVIAGFLFFTGWWLIIDVAAQGPSSAEFPVSYYVCGVMGSLGLFMINSVSNGQLRGDAFTEGCMGPRGARLWLFVGFVVGFASLIASGWIVLGGHGNNGYQIAVFVQNLFIFASGLVYKFGRSEDLWG